MLRSHFRGKQPSDSTAKEEKDHKKHHGKSSFFFHHDAQNDEDKITCTLHEANGNDEAYHEFYETPPSSSSEREADNEEGNALSKFLAAEGLGNNESVTVVKDHDHDALGFAKDQKQGFTNSERQIYEMQLAQLQEQLVNTMIDHQEMSCKLKKLQHVDVDKLQKDLRDQREKNRELKDKLKQQKKMSSSKLQRKNASRSDPRGHSHAADMADRGSDDWVDLGREEEISSPSSASNGTDEHSVASSHLRDETCQDLDGDRLDSPAGLPEGGDSGGDSHRVQDLRTKLEKWKNKAVDVIVDRLWDFVNDEPEADEEVDGEGEPLAVKTLKENINRFSAGIKPITSFIKSVGGILSWSNPTASILTFVVYMYSVWCGHLLSLLLLIMIWNLFVNYLHARGVAKQLGFAERIQEEPNNSEDQSWSDKFHLVLQVARKVQNTLGKMADSLEKVKSLLNWQHPEATRKLFTGLCLSCLASLVLRGPTLFMLIGLIMGIKLFIIKAVYRRFPKVKRRYDSTARLWRELPTDVELAEREAAEICQDTLQRASSASSLPSTSGYSSELQSPPPSVNLFAERFKLPSLEIPLPDWEEGRRCVLMDKEKPLSNFKHGRLHLTQSYLCFDKYRSSSGKNIIIKLDTVTSISKAKPIGLMPGTGMALELHVRGVDKPYIFGGIIGRDDVFESIKATARAGNIPWALS